MADEKTDPVTTDDRVVERVEPRKPLEADYGDATPEDVALALLRYRPERKNG